MTKDKNFIGSQIKKALKEKGHSAIWLAEEIHCKRRNVYDIFHRDSLDTAQLLKISLALKTNFFVYFYEIYEKMMYKTKYVTRKIHYIPQDEIHIGSLIKNKLEENEHTVNWLAEKIHCKRSNLYHIFNNRSSMDTARLLQISIVLQTNFFVYYCELYKNIISERLSPSVQSKYQRSVGQI